MLAPRGQAPSLVNSSNSWVGQPSNKYLPNKCVFIPFSRTRAPHAGLPEHAATIARAHSTASCQFSLLSRKRGYTGLVSRLGLPCKFPHPSSSLLLSFPSFQSKWAREGTNPHLSDALLQLSSESALWRMFKEILGTGEAGNSIKKKKLNRTSWQKRAHCGGLECRRLDSAIS